MATRKKSKKRTKSKPAAARKAAPKKRATQKQKKTAKARTTPKRAAAVRSGKLRKSGLRARGAIEQNLLPSGSNVQSGDLQGLRNVEAVNSESVTELLEEGNAFEADAVAGVEDAEGDHVREVHTHEVPEDDVPEEYLDKD